MTRESVLLSPMNTYFKLLGKDFNSNSRAYKKMATFYVKVLNQQRHYLEKWFAKLATPMLILASFEKYICASPSLLS
jgi:hypothetical protein